MFAPDTHSNDLKFRPYTGKFTLYEEKDFDSPYSFTNGPMKIFDVHSIVMESSGLCEFKEEDSWQIYDASGSVSFYNKDDEEIAQMDISTWDINRDVLKTVNNLFGFDLESLAHLDAVDNEVN